MHFFLFTLLDFFCIPTSFIFSSVLVKFIYSEKATKVCEISTLLLSYVVAVKSKVEISQNLVAFSEYMNFTSKKINEKQFSREK